MNRSVFWMSANVDADLSLVSEGIQVSRNFGDVGVDRIGSLRFSGKTIFDTQDSWGLLMLKLHTLLIGNLSRSVYMI